MKLAELSKAQEAKMLEVREYWLNYIFSCRNRLDREKASKGIEWLYKLSGFERPIIVFVDSPMACQFAASLIKGWMNDLPKILESSQVMSQVRSQVMSQVMSQVWSQVGSQVWSQVESGVWSQVWSQVKSLVLSQVASQVRSQVVSEVVSQVRSQVVSQVRSQVRSQVGSQV